MSHSDQRADLLERLAVTPAASQRSLSRDLGVALGLTNRLLRDLIAEGLVSVSSQQDGRRHYQLTPAGEQERQRQARARLAWAVARYCDVRERWNAILLHVSASFAAGVPRAVMFFGTSAVAEIGFVCLQDWDIELRGVFDDCGRGWFFGAPVLPAGALCIDALRESDDARLVVATLDHVALAHEQLATGRVPADRTFWV